MLSSYILSIQRYNINVFAHNKIFLHNSTTLLRSHVTSLSYIIWIMTQVSIYAYNVQTYILLLHSTAGRSSHPNKELNQYNLRHITIKPFLTESSYLISKIKKHITGSQALYFTQKWEKINLWQVIRNTYTHQLLNKQYSEAMAKGSN